MRLFFRSQLPKLRPPFVLTITCLALAATAFACGSTHEGLAPANDGGADAESQDAGPAHPDAGHDAGRDAAVSCSYPKPDDCSGACTSVLTDPENCGACGNACPAGASCTSSSGGGGVATSCECPAGETDCTAQHTCADLATDLKNCGACGNACSSGASCVASGSASACACPSGQTDCKAQGTCADLASDPNNCGACGKRCDQGASCSSAGGSPACACPAGQTDCTGQGTCADLTSDPNNCGACGNACGAGQSCVTSGGVTSCVDPCNAHASCGECANDGACGWCVIDQTCISVSASGTCGFFEYGTC